VIPQTPPTEKQLVGYRGSLQVCGVHLPEAILARTYMFLREIVAHVVTDLRFLYVPGLFSANDTAAISEIF
jgi:hypothetical protein